MMFYGICGIFLCSVSLILPSQVQKLQHDMPLGASVDKIQDSEKWNPTKNVLESEFMNS
jgi:hypothetical protein